LPDSCSLPLPLLPWGGTAAISTTQPLNLALPADDWPLASAGRRYGR
jgi:LDH2 family malate/lactate/ureidoglycolate dehydrogenase